MHSHRSQILLVLRTICGIGARKSEQLEEEMLLWGTAPWGRPRAALLDVRRISFRPNILPASLSGHDNLNLPLDSAATRTSGLTFTWQSQSLISQPGNNLSSALVSLPTKRFSLAN
jgi:hypothetical protein